MYLALAGAVLLPFLGTGLGAAGVFFLGRDPGRGLGRGLTGFAAGVMVASSVWSLILPAIEQSSHLGRLAFVPAFLGIWAGFLFLLGLDRLTQRLHRFPVRPGGSTMLVLAVALHNLPEGMAVGAAAAGWLAGSPGMTAAGVLTLSLGIALQNLPEGAIISMPLKAAGLSRGRAFGWGVLSGAVEPLGAVATLLLSRLLVPMMPCLLSFSAGAMLFVVVQELIPEAAEGETCLGSLFFAFGFCLMMALDVALG